MTRRILSLWLPNLALERHFRARRRQQQRHPTSLDETVEDLVAKPYALIASTARGTFIRAVNKAASKVNIAPGMKLTDARALFPGLVTDMHRPDKDQRALTNMADWMLRYSPSVQIDGTDGLLIDCTGCCHLFGGEQAMVDHIRTRLTSLGYHSRLGLADTIGAAWGIARFSATASTLVPIGQVEAQLALLPVAALRLSPDQIHGLEGLGLKTIAQLYDIPRASLQRRFLAGNDGTAVLTRLDQTLGRIDEPLDPRQENPPLRFLTSPAEAILTHEEIECAFDDLLQNLHRALEKQLTGVLHLTLRGFHGSGGVDELTVRLAQPSRNLTHLRNLFLPKLEQIDPGFGIDAFLLTADRIDNLQAKQFSLDGRVASDGEQQEAFGQLVDRLANRLGRGRVYQVEARNSHIPERSMQPVSPGAGVTVLETEDGHMPPYRPITLFDQPEMIDVMAEIPEGPPLTFRWRRVLRQVTRARGPERILPEWWLDMSNSERVRDYYEVEDQTGQRYWLYREGLYGDPVEKGAPLWRVHGLFA